MIKRLFDIVCSLGGILVFAPVMLVCAVLVRLTSTGPVIFSQQRVGQNFRPFAIYKFRSMVADAPQLGGQVTVDRDPRITFVGRVMRKAKLDELPQLFNVLKGDMSFVGPRPEVAQYVEMFKDDYEELLTVRPGITDIGSIVYRHEEDILAQSTDPRSTYINTVLPEKIRLSKQYVRSRSLLGDVRLILKTILTVIGCGSVEAPSECPND